MKKITIILSLILIVSACSNPRIENKIVYDNTLATVLFFSNGDNCNTCDLQAEILKELIIEVKDYIEFQEIINTKDNLSIINSYGIKSFPSVVIIDPNENIIKKFPPGIQSANNIKKYLNKN